MFFNLGFEKTLICAIHQQKFAFVLEVFCSSGKNQIALINETQVYCYDEQRIMKLFPQILKVRELLHEIRVALILILNVIRSFITRTVSLLKRFYTGTRKDRRHKAELISSRVLMHWLRCAFLFVRCYIRSYKTWQQYLKKQEEEDSDEEEDA